MGAYLGGIRRPSIERGCRGGHILWAYTSGLLDFVNPGLRCSKSGQQGVSSRPGF